MTEVRPVLTSSTDCQEVETTGKQYDPMSVVDTMCRLPCNHHVLIDVNSLQISEICTSLKDCRVFFKRYIEHGLLNLAFSYYAHIFECVGVYRISSDCFLNPNMIIIQSLITTELTRIVV